MANKNTSPVILIIRFLISILIFLGILFGPAGTFNWPEAWIVLVFFLIGTFGAFKWMKKNDPELLKERMSNKKDAKDWDKKIIRAYSIFLILTLVIAGLDAVRFQLSSDILIKINGRYFFLDPV